MMLWQALAPLLPATAAPAASAGAQAGGKAVAARSSCHGVPAACPGSAAALQAAYNLAAQAEVLQGSVVRPWARLQGAALQQMAAEYYAHAGNAAAAFPLAEAALRTLTTILMSTQADEAPGKGDCTYHYGVAYPHCTYD